MNINVSLWIKYGIIYPEIWKYIKLYLVAFPTLSLVERCLLNYLSLRIYYNIMYLQVLSLLKGVHTNSNAIINSNY